VSILHKETLTLNTNVEGEPDEDGLPTYTTSSVDYAGFNVQPVISTRATEGMTDELLVTKRYKVSGPQIPNITAASWITWRGQKFKPWGDPTPFYTGPIPHAEFLMIAWSG